MPTAEKMMGDDEGLLRSTRRDELPVVVPKVLVDQVLRFVYGSRVNGHYRMTRTMAKLVRRYWRQTMARDTVAFIRNCPQCTVSEDRQPGRQAALQIVHPKRRFAQVAFDKKLSRPGPYKVSSR